MGAVVGQTATSELSAIQVFCAYSALSHTSQLSKLKHYASVY